VYVVRSSIWFMRLLLYRQGNNTWVDRLLLFNHQKIQFTIENAFYIKKHTRYTELERYWGKISNAPLLLNTKAFTTLQILWKRNDFYSSRCYIIMYRSSVEKHINVPMCDVWIEMLQISRRQIQMFDMISYIGLMANTQNASPNAIQRMER